METSSAAQVPHSHNENEEGHEMHQKEKQWAEAAKHVRGVREQGGFPAFMQGHPQETSKLTEHACDCVCCMDGRVAPFKDAITIAGSGILIKDDPEARERFIKELKARGIKRLTSHDECGALSLYAKAKGLTSEEAEQHMSAWLEELAAELGSAVEPERIPVTLHFHNEVCAYVVMTDRFSSAGALELPTGFQVTASVVSSEDLFAQIEVALNIAFGDHGFGDLFTEEVPFSVVVVANNEEELAEMQGRPELSALVASYGGRAVIDGFVLTGAAESAVAA